MVEEVGAEVTSEVRLEDSAAARMATVMMAAEAQAEAASASVAVAAM